VTLLALCVVALYLILRGYLPDNPGQDASVDPSLFICHTTGPAIGNAIPADASFQHIHSEQGMADVMIEPGRVGWASVTIRLLGDELKLLAAQTVTLTLAPPKRGGKPVTRPALLDAAGQWHVDGIELTEPGNWTVTVDANLRSNVHLELTGPIVIDPR